MYHITHRCHDRDFLLKFVRDRDDYRALLRAELRNSNVSVEEISTQPLHAYVLAQNCPNPFNQATTISYQVPSACHVHLAVYNILGQLVETLVDTPQSAGNHSAIWNAHEVSPGIYFYKLTIDRISKIKKCLVLK